MSQRPLGAARHGRGQHHSERGLKDGKDLKVPIVHSNPKKIEVGKILLKQW